MKTSGCECIDEYGEPWCGDCAFAVWLRQRQQVRSIETETSVESADGDAS